MRVVLHSRLCRESPLTPGRAFHTSRQLVGMAFASPPAASRRVRGLGRSPRSVLLTRSRFGGVAIARAALNLPQCPVLRVGQFREQALMWCHLCALCAVRAQELGLPSRAALLARANKDLLHVRAFTSDFFLIPAFSFVNSELRNQRPCAPARAQPRTTVQSPGGRCAQAP